MDTGFDVIFVAGPQGSGKGTQGRKLAEKLDFLFWEMGKTLREVSTEDSTLGRMVAVINQGVLLSDEIIIEVLKEKLPAALDDRGVVFDGVPRRLGQAEFLIDLLQKQGKSNMATLFIDLDREECIRRLLRRAEHESRVDDTPEIIETRFRYYDEVMKPAMDYLKQKTIFITIDGSPAVEEVQKKINEAMGIS
jgi:adenylate kinase